MWDNLPEVCSKGCAITYTHNWQVRATGGEGFVFPTNWWDFHNRGNNSYIRIKNPW
jgi:hypothetical protein